MKYPHLFQEGRIGARTVKNRIVLSPMGDNMTGADGQFTDQGIAFYTERAKGGAGIIFIGAVPVDYAEGRSHANAYRMEYVKDAIGMGRLVESVHAYGALVIPQLQHAGARTRASYLDGNLPRCVSDIDPETTSIRNCRAEGPQKVLTTEELKGLIPKYVRTAQLCQRAGCDGVEIHMTHSFLLNQLLSPDTNHRTDEYGGSLENRMRLPLEIVRAVREAVGRRFIISARIPGAEFVKNGLTPDEIVTISKALEEAGVDVLNISIGMTTLQTKIKEPEGSPEGTRIANAKRIKDAVSIPVMTSGVLKTPAFCEEVLKRGDVDFVLLARQMICDPYWPAKAMHGKEDEIRPCLNCNTGCFMAIDKTTSLGCVINPEAGEEYRHISDTKADQPKNVMVIGGGLNGMQAAITAAKRGHKVSLYEKDDHLGGQMNLAAVPPDKDSVAKALKHFIAETERSGVEVHTGCEVTEALVKEKKPDVVLHATGATPWAPPIPGKEKALWSWDVLRDEAKAPRDKKVAVIGGGLVGCETALHLCGFGNRVTVIEMLPAIAGEMEGGNREQLINHLNDQKVEQLTGTRVLEITDGGVKCSAADGREITVDADTVILAMGQAPYGNELLTALRAFGDNIRIIGDDLTPATFGGATKRGYLAAATI